MTNTPAMQTEDGIMAGEYASPVTGLIFPELDVPGINSPAYPFKNIRDLVQGTILDGKQYGSLNLFPGAAPPAPSETCSPSDLLGPNATPTPNPSPMPGPPVVAPVASVAQIASAQRVGTNFLLVGSNTESKVSNNDINFRWNQISPSSPIASITNSGSPNATVLAPKVTAETSFVFELALSSKSNPNITSKVNVNVTTNPTINDTVTLDTYT